MAGSLALNRRVTLQRDRTHSRRDRFGRLLAYVRLPGKGSRSSSTATTSTTSSSTTTTPSGCAASYPDVCIPPPPPDLDCSQIPYRNFRVIYTVPQPDPHNFDGDRDGIGCES
jgi:micrococcal nuclease